MRAINITGKHNIDKINEIGNETYKAVRKHMAALDEAVLNHATQLDVLRNLYIIGPDYKSSNTSLYLSELNHKIQSYKDQDKKKELHDQATLINLEEVLEKLVGSQLTCCYCSKPISVLYKNVREPTQWTLDRIDNALSHTRENTCIACLKCNLQRRTDNHEYFKNGKQFKCNIIR